MEKERLSKKRVGAAAPGPAEDGTGGTGVLFFSGWWKAMEEISRASILKLFDKKKVLLQMFEFL